MGNGIFYLETKSLNPRFNLAFEEYILHHRMAGNYLLLWQNNNTVVIGQNQNAEAEINRAFVEERQINVVRRSTGGGAVYHDLGNLNYSFITDAGNAEELAMQRFTGPVVDALRKLGLQAEASGRNDILVEGLKVSGTAQRLFRNRILHHGTLLFDSDSTMIAGALNADPAKFQSKSVRSVRSRVGNIRLFLKEDMELSEFWRYLKEHLAGRDLIFDELTLEELKEVEKLKQQKYDTWEWNFGSSPAYTMKNKRRWNGGTLEVYLYVEHGRITDISFYGDFLSRQPLTELKSALRHCPYQEQAFSAILSTFELSNLFGSISKHEILKTVFCD